MKKLPYEYREYEGEKGRGGKRGERRGREEEGEGGRNAKWYEVCYVNTLTTFKDVLERLVCYRHVKFIFTRNPR